MERTWPAMDSEAATAQLLADASRLAGRPVVGMARGGASDASHFADTIALTVDGLGPRGGGAHTPEEFVLRDALHRRAEVALAVAHAALA
jgi:glutamate carboxypeptidase